MREEMKRSHRDNQGVSPVIASLLMVTITVVLASTIYIAMSNVLPSFNGIPKVGLQTEPGGMTDTQMRILVMNNEKSDLSFSAYKVVIVKNNSVATIDATTIKTGPITTGSDGTTVSYSDEGNGKLTAGDTFLVTGLMTSSKYDFYVVYDGNVAGAVSWNT
jgi:flagellin-like protein